MDDRGDPEEAKGGRLAVAAAASVTASAGVAVVQCGKGGRRGQVRADQCGHVREIAQGSILGPSGEARPLTLSSLSLCSVSHFSPSSPISLCCCPRNRLSPSHNSSLSSSFMKTSDGFCASLNRLRLERFSVPVSSLIFRGHLLRRLRG